MCLDKVIRVNRWQCWWLALTWSIWQHRNSILFSNAVFNGNKVFEDAVFLLWTGLRSLERNFTIHYNQWSSNLRNGFVQLRISHIKSIFLPMFLSHWLVPIKTVFSLILEPSIWFNSLCIVCTSGTSYEYISIFADKKKNMCLYCYLIQLSILNVSGQNENFDGNIFSFSWLL